MTNNDKCRQAITFKRERLIRVSFPHLPHLSKFLSFRRSQRSLKAYFNILSDASMETVAKE